MRRCSPVWSGAARPSGRVSPIFSTDALLLRGPRGSFRPPGRTVRRDGARLLRLPLAPLAVPAQAALERGQDRVVVPRDAPVHPALEPDPAHPRVEGLVGLLEVHPGAAVAQVLQPGTP